MVKEKQTRMGCYEMKSYEETFNSFSVFEGTKCILSEGLFRLFSKRILSTKCHWCMFITAWHKVFLIVDTCTVVQSGELARVSVCA